MTDLTSAGTKYLVVDPSVTIGFAAVSTSGVTPPEGAPATGSTTNVVTTALKLMPPECTQIPFSFQMPSERN